MGSKDLAVAILLVMLVFRTGSSDLEQDRTECANQLVGLASCLPYVSGTAGGPTLECCTGLRQVLDKSGKCLCVLIKDRDNPKLGLKMNATLAASLPSSCHASANVSQCIDALHLAPGSPDAKLFAGFANVTKGTSTPNVPATGNSTSVEEKSGSEMAKSSKWIKVKVMICGLFWLWTLINVF